MIELDVKERMEELIAYLNEATIAYDGGNPYISDKEWDEKYFELQELEQKYRFSLPNSPTNLIYPAKVKSELHKVTHNHAMLSLDKTKSLDDLRSFIGDKDCIAMSKLDGLTCSLYYEGGKLICAETRGDGRIGEDITHNAMVIPSIPKTVKTKGELVVDGEILCSQQDFKEFSKDYAHPRNFAAGSIRLLDANECQKRKLTFVVWDVVKGFEQYPTLSKKLKNIRDENSGFKVVKFFKVDKDTKNLAGIIESIKNKEDGYPIDGAVIKYNDCAYYNYLGATAHHFRGGLAFKFYDESYETHLLDVEWTMGRTGVLTPVACFEPVWIDDCEVTRASLHNISIMKNLGIQRAGSLISVYKSNQIIPQVKRVIRECGGARLEIPDKCPICGGETRIEISDTGTEVLVCANPKCQGKFTNVVNHFLGQRGLNIKGINKATVDKLIENNLIKTLSDIFTLEEHAREWIKIPGCGAISVEKALAAIKKGKECYFWQFISALGIPNIGMNYAKVLGKHFFTWDEFMEAVRDNNYSFTAIEGFGAAMNDSLKGFDYTEANKIAPLLTFIDEQKTDNSNSDSSISGLTFVITGKLVDFKRAELIDYIESRGGKVAGAISKKTNYLINNDAESTSAKNKAAKANNIPIITEDDFVKKFIES